MNCYNNALVNCVYTVFSPLHMGENMTFKLRIPDFHFILMFHCKEFYMSGKLLCTSSPVFCLFFLFVTADMSAGPGAGHGGLFESGLHHCGSECTIKPMAVWVSLSVPPSFLYSCSPRSLSLEKTLLSPMLLRNASCPASLLSLTLAHKEDTILQGCD